MQIIKRFFSVKTSYIIVFISLASWAFFAYFTMNQMIQSQKSYAKIINISGKQRMLSQKTTLMVKRYYESNDEKIYQHLNELILLMKSDHKYLTNNLTSKHMENIYFSSPHNLNKNVNKYFNLLDSFLEDKNSNIIKQIENYSFKLLPELNFAVNEFEKESDKTIKKLQDREEFILIGTLLTLILEVFLIMIPTLKKIRNVNQELREFNTKLELEVTKKTKQIKKEHKRKKFYLDHINCLLVSLDKKGNITMINKIGCDILGYDEKELIGKNWFEINVLSNDEKNYVYKFFKKIIKGNSIFIEHSFENSLIDKYGNKRVFKWSNSLLKEKGKIVGVLSSGIDITRQKDQDKIILEQRKLSSMGEMIGNIAHQWRQPLSVISTAATGTLMEKSVGVLKDEKLETNLNLINDNAQHLSKTIDIFRDFLKEKKELKEVVLQEKINKVFKILQASLTNEHIKLKDNFNQVEPIKINLVAGELSQVIINIINNAKDAILENNIKEPWIDVKLAIQKSKVILSIEDNAGGIDDKIISNVFEPYFTTKHKSQGTGLGLHMSYKIIKDSLKGDIYVKNTKNGAKFTIELPLS